MPSPFRLGSLLRSSPLLVLLGIGGVATAVTVAGPSLGLPSASGGSITDSPKEVIDQVWQIVYRDFLDSSGEYTQDRWKQLRRDLLHLGKHGERVSLTRSPSNVLKSDHLVKHSY